MEVAALRNHNLFVKKLVLGAAVGAVALSAGLSARPAQATPATLGFYPATDIYGPGVFHLDVDTYGHGIKADAFQSTGVTYGIGDGSGVFGRSEIGFDYTLSAGGNKPINGSTGGLLSTTKRFAFNAKTQLWDNSAKGERVVGGVWGVGSKDAGAPNVGYIEGSKTFGFGRIHLGVAQNFAGKIGGVRVTDLGTDNDKFSVSAGFDRYITPKVQFAVDYYTGKNSYAGAQPTLYYYVNDKADFGLGLYRLNSKNAAIRNQVYICFDYNFGGKTAEAAPVAAPVVAPK